MHLSVDSRRYDQFISRRAGQGLPSGHLDPPGSVLPGQCHHTHCQYLHITYWQFSANFRHLFLLSPPRHLSQVRCCRAAVRSSPRHSAEKAKSKSKSKSEIDYNKHILTQYWWNQDWIIFKLQLQMNYSFHPYTINLFRLREYKFPCLAPVSLSPGLSWDQVLVSENRFGAKYLLSEQSCAKSRI